MTAQDRLDKADSLFRLDPHDRAKAKAWLDAIAAMVAAYNTLNPKPMPPGSPVEVMRANGQRISMRDYCRAIATAQGAA